MKLNLKFLIYLDLSYQYRANYTKRTAEIQHDSNSISNDDDDDTEDEGCNIF